jgi:5-methylcytosine-specific restriction endonuclease McrA
MASKKRNLEKKKAYTALYLQRNREAILEKKKRYREANREKIAAYDKAYRESGVGREKKRLSEQRRRAAKRNVLGNDCTPQQWQDLVRFYSPDGCCLACGRVSELTADHVVPLSKGGTNSVSNIQPLCRPCNNAKYTQEIDYRFDKGAVARDLDLIESLADVMTWQGTPPVFVYSPEDALKAVGAKL